MLNPGKFLLVVNARNGSELRPPKDGLSKFLVVPIMGEKQQHSAITNAYFRCQDIEFAHQEAPDESRWPSPFALLAFLVKLPEIRRRGPAMSNPVSMAVNGTRAHRRSSADMQSARQVLSPRALVERSRFLGQSLHRLIISSLSVAV
jgi:hypothetical protein